MILALDPSANDLGRAVLDSFARRIDSGVWHPSEAKIRDGHPRFCQLASFVAFKVVEHEVRYVVVEIPDGGERHFRSGGKVFKAGGKSERTYSMAVGVCIGAAAVSSAISTHEVSVNQWKGRARKGLAGLVIASIFKLPHTTNHNELDALGLGHWWATVGRRAALTPAAGEVPAAAKGEG
jgi:hypothetical protein